MNLPSVGLIKGIYYSFVEIIMLGLPAKVAHDSEKYDHSRKI
jgi:hypothetical protein